ncbi:MAG: Npt1/Npt2 family nucleotide transporter [Myxococcota bacterium]|nr:Npt1/Npt2 family nucleotide transporter [Myxococcota bacterium]
MERRSPLKAVMDVRREERPLAFLMFTYFLLVITSFWVLKPIKKSLFLEFYSESGLALWGLHFGAAEAELIAKNLNMLVAFVAVIVFTALANHLRRQQLTLVFTAFFLACYVAYAQAIDEPGHAVVWSFYLFGDLFSTLMVATFFAFLNDSVTPDASKRLYGPVGLGGVIGGVVGSTTVAGLIAQLERVSWLWTCFALALLIAAVAWSAGRLVDRDPPPEPEPEPDAPAAGGNPALEGGRLVFRSPYLLAIVGIVGLYEIVSTVMDFQFSATVVHYLKGPEIGRQFSTVFAITNWVSMLVQLLFTSFVMTRFGVGIALMVLPLAALGGSAAFAALPILWFGSLLNTADNGFSYSINQSAKEALYVPTSRDEKYKAKAFIDMFVQRFAKAIASLVALGMGQIATGFSSVRWLSLFTIAVIGLWLVAVRYAGRHYREMTEGEGS